MKEVIRLHRFLSSIVFYRDKYSLAISGVSCLSWQALNFIRVQLIILNLMGKQKLLIEGLKPISDVFVGRDLRNGLNGCIGQSTGIHDLSKFYW